jgi:hypothetical protein
MTDLFATAPTVAPKPAAAKKGKKKEFALSETHTLYAAAKSLVDSATTIVKTLEAEVKAETKEIFANEGVRLNGQPENFDGISAHASSNCQLRHRASTSVLSEEEVRIAKENGIPLAEKVTKEAVPERFFFEESLLSNPEYRAKISAALSTIDFGGISPIVRQAPEEKVFGYIVAENAIDELFKKVKDTTKAKELMSIVGVLALKTKFDGTLQDAVKILDEAGIKL